MDLNHDTREGLDWPRVLAALAEHASTEAGARAVLALGPLGHGEVCRVMEAMSEVRLLEQDEAPLHVGGISDVREPVDAARKGSILDHAPLRDIGYTLLSMEELGERLEGEATRVPVLAAMGQELPVGLDLTGELRDAFDRSGQLCGERYPELAELRRQIFSYQSSIQHTLEELVRGDELADLLQDRFITTRSERYVIPLKAFAKGHDVGIVQGVSGSGQTVFVEPHQVVALNNRLRLAEAQLEAAERRILAELSRMVAQHASDILAGLDAATALDLVVARERFAMRLSATRPVVRQDGVIAVHQARHPLLVLREIAVVANDLALSSDRPALMLTGPNAGGKTVALKTLGLCAMLVQIGCWVPADEGSRVDYFDGVFASIGDAQSVAEDLSSFSGHLAVLRELVTHAGPGHLALLDEIAVGTDPAQGAALAQAVIEQLVERGSRLVITTHFGRLKSLAVLDPRFTAAAVEYREGRPTYRLVSGSTGESHALSIARTMGIDPTILARAEHLMGQGERAFAQATEALEVERSATSKARFDLQQRASELERRQRKLEAREETLRTRSKELEERASEAFRSRLARAEEAIGAVVADLQRDPSHEAVSRARSTIEALAALAPTPQPAEVEQGPLSAGDRVRTSAGQVGEVMSIRGNRVEIRIGGMVVRARRGELTRLSGTLMPPSPAPAPAAAPTRRAPPVDLAGALRIEANTVDLRGKRVDEGIDCLERAFDRAALRGMDTLFVLHGHGTGAMKKAVREWMRTASFITQWAPANADQGGDAYTIAAIR